jgi:hypothetical protein
MYTVRCVTHRRSLRKGNHDNPGKDVPWYLSLISGIITNRVGYKGLHVKPNSAQ